MREILTVMALVIALAAAPAFGDGRCTGFKWDISKELALWSEPSVMLTAGDTIAAAPAIAVGRLYEVHLMPQAAVTFAVAPGRSPPTDGTYAGLALLKLDAPGNHRIAVDVPLWIDVVAHGQLATVTDFQGQQNCDGPHKIVEFELNGAQPFVLQLSGSPKATVRVSATLTPPRTQ